MRPSIPLARIALLVVAAKTVFLLLDPTVRFFLGDSASYLWSAYIGVSPPDRSFTFPLLIRFFAQPAESLFPLLLLQTAFGVAVALIAFRILVGAFALDARIAAVAALCVAIGPEQLLFERMVMAESAGLLAFAVMLACGFAYLRRGALAWLLGVAVAGIGAVSFRMSLLPIVLGFAPLPPLAYYLCGGPKPRRATGLLIALAVALLATGAMHAAYKRAWVMHEGTKHDYIFFGGFFRLGLVAPLVEPADFEGLGLPADFLSHLAPPLKDPFAREAQLWAPNGLMDLLRRQFGDAEGSRAARKIAARALRRHPWGLVQMGVSTLADYFHPGITSSRMRGELGMLALPAQLVAELRERFHYDAQTVPFLQTPVFRYFRASAGWLTACLFGLVPVSLLMLAAAWRSERRAAAALLCATSIGLFAGHVLFSHIVSYRYLHAFPLLVWLNLGALAAALLARRGRSGIAAPVDPEPR